MTRRVTNIVSAIGGGALRRTARLRVVINPASIDDTMSAVAGVGTPYTGGPGTIYTSQLFILPPSRDRLWRSQWAAGAYAAWEEMAIPEGDWTELFMNQSGGGPFILLGDQLATKPIIGVNDAVDRPWTAYPTDAALHGGMPYVYPSGFAGEGDSPAFAMGVDNIMYGAYANSAFSDIGVYTEALPAGTWRKVNTIKLGSEGRAVTVVGLGDKVARWDSWNFSDTAWELIDCPDGDWRDVVDGNTANSDVRVAVGVGTNKAMCTLDGGATWNALTVPEGWEPVDPKIFFAQFMVDDDANGTFIAIGGKVGSETDIVGFKLLNDDTVGAGFLMEYPLPSVNNRWKAIAGVVADEINGQGVIIVGNEGTTDPEDVTIISNPADYQTFDDWTAKTLADAPF